MLSYKPKITIANTPKDFDHFFVVCGFAEFVIIILGLENISKLTFRSKTVNISHMTIDSSYSEFKTLNLTN